MKEIEKYVGYYLLVYICVLIICGFFQYFAVCQGKSLECNFSMIGINTIITTTAYVVTPIVAMIGFISWKSQHNIKLHSSYAQEVLKNYEHVFDLILSFNNIHKYTESKILSLDLNPQLTIDEKSKTTEQLIGEMKFKFYEELRNVEIVINRLIQKSVILGYLVPQAVSVSDKSAQLKIELEMIKECLNEVATKREISYLEGFHLLKEACSHISEIAERNIEPCLSEIKKFIEA